MAVREFQFIVGPETSTLPSVGTPSADEDLLSLGYANAHYVQGKEAVADIAALKAVTDTGDNARVDRDVIFVDAKEALYYFDSASAATGDDEYIVTPDSGTGRWILLTDTPSNARMFSEESGTPATPVTGTDKLYFKSDGLLYQLDDAGVESQVATASGGAGQTFTDASTSGVTVTTGTTHYHPNLDIQSGDTYTINSGGTLLSVSDFVVSSGGSLVINGTVRVL